MSGEMTAWWMKYPGKEEQAKKVLSQFRPAVESRIRWYERHYNGHVDWAPKIWNAAYRAAFACDSPYCWPLLKEYIFRAGRDGIKLHKRRSSKLARVPFDEKSELDTE